MIIEDPGQDRIITELYAYIATDPSTGLEGICGVSLEGRQMQAVTSSPATATAMKPIMDDMAKRVGKKIELVRFKRIS
jgi:hypothetical protein